MAMLVSRLRLLLGAVLLLTMFAVAPPASTQQRNPDASVNPTASSVKENQLLLFPFYGTNVAEMQLAEIVHGVVAVLFVAAMLGHIYIGTLGMEGAFEAMWDGTVDVNWAKEHHSIWLEKEASRGNLTSPPAQGTMQAAE
jgi:hypothetical protein